MGVTSGELIVKARKATGLSAAELARQIGVTRGFISLLEKDATHISQEKAQKIASVLGVSPLDLGFKEDEPPVTNPEWLKYLSAKFNLSDDDRRELLKIVSRVGIPEDLPGESRKEFRGRWEDFYQNVSIFLPNASAKMLQHPDVQPFLKGIVSPLDGILTWDMVFSAFDRQIEERFQTEEGIPDNGRDWLSVVCNCLKLLITDDDCRDEAEFSRRPDTLAIRSFVRSSRRIYGAVLKDADGASYRYMANDGDTLFNRGDFPIWHEAVRVMVDPDLKAKTGAYYYPDGEDRPPLEFVICRLAARLACWPFRDIWRARKDDVSPVAVQEFVKDVYLGLPWRVAYVGLLDFCKEPYVYVDCYKRLKRTQLKEKKIAMEDVVAMAKDADAKLRIGFVFRNLAAEKTSFELRHNLRIPEESTISKAMQSQVNEVIVGYDDLAQWDFDYDLKGSAKVSAVRQDGTFGDVHVRAVMKVCGEE